ncbi:hypothetical protein AC611_23345 [Xanthomonas phaseoli pv. phaseoli]|nr:hypothetical protein AC609_23340 [Xanthomonas phaseoli pv. phaseoli]AZU28177.1 hypothetical protein AC611_23345 [Xanthomonas phaseoli pv. phaseoli]AZU36878.1 hypothetical protein AC610_22390 [Xanthomonas phaseoli pv. phaseoli]KII98393.1 hypothetical protein ST27_16285 [Xanthomonas phaseoli pv. phaseoli]KKY05976.1 hypothetical protein RM64_22380 [Xanthomonas phaseoli pv. phaseoli]
MTWRRRGRYACDVANSTGAPVLPRESFFGQPEGERIGRCFSIAQGAACAEVLDYIGIFNTPDATLVQ